MSEGGVARPMEVPPGLVDDAVAARLRGLPPAYPGSMLSMAGLRPGAVGVLEAGVRAVSPVRTYGRRNGREGQLCRVTLAQGRDEVDLVLWDDETRLAAAAGPLRPGARVRLRGASVKAGYRGGLELALGGAVLEPVEAPPLRSALEGLLVSIGDVRSDGRGAGTRFNAEVRLATPGGEVAFVAWDEAVKAVRALGVGSRVRVHGLAPHPWLEAWFVAAEAARVEPL
jgi:ssDNA-binding replication factor A large subunit